MTLQRIHVIDSHTGGEPTRVVVASGPDLGRGTMAERRERFQRDHDNFRAAVVNEPRGSDVLVGALLCEPVDPANAAGVIFFNNVGYLNMCGHGAIGVVHASDVTVGGRTLPQRRTYSDLREGQAGAVVGSAGLIEIVVREGNASEMLRLRRGDEVLLRDR